VCLPYYPQCIKFTTEKLFGSATYKNVFLLRKELEISMGTDRRDFLKKTALAGGAILAAP
jgi:hypothetical protein